MTGYLDQPADRSEERESKEQASVEKFEAKRENPHWVSNCCGAYINNTDYDFCPDCKEHCEIIDLSKEDEQ